jgi:hypothetical protein
LLCGEASEASCSNSTICPAKERSHDIGLTHSHHLMAFFLCMYLLCFSAWTADGLARTSWMTTKVLYPELKEETTRQTAMQHCRVRSEMRRGYRKLPTTVFVT